FRAGRWHRGARCHNVALMRTRHGGPVLEGARLRRRVPWSRRLRVLGALWLGVAVALGLAAGTAVAAAAPGAGTAAAHVASSQLSARSQAAQEEPSSPTAPAPVRIGGSDPQPSPGTPGWVWWGVGSFAVALAVGTYRLWGAAATQMNRRRVEDVSTYRDRKSVGSGKAGATAW